MESGNNKIETNAYNMLLRDVLDYLCNNRLIDAKQVEKILEYCDQDENQKKKIKQEDIDKILSQLGDKYKKSSMKVPAYDEFIKNVSIVVDNNNLGYLEKKAIHNKLRKTFNTFIFNKNGKSDFYKGVKLLIDRVKEENEKSRRLEENRLNDKTTGNKKGTSNTHSFGSLNTGSGENGNYQTTTTAYKGQMRVASQVPYTSEVSYMNPDEQERSERKEKADANNDKMIQEILLKDEKAFNKLINSEEKLSDDCFGKSYSLDEKMRKNYLREVIRLNRRQSFFTEIELAFNSNVAEKMIKYAKEIENIIYTQLIELNLSEYQHTKLYKQTLSKDVFDSKKLLEGYKFLYERYANQFHKLSDFDKRNIRKFFEKKKLDFIPSVDDIKNNINSRIQEKMIEKKFGTKNGDAGKLSGTNGLTCLMDIKQIASTKRRITEKLKEGIIEPPTDELQNSLVNLQRNFSMAIFDKKFYAPETISDNETFDSVEQACVDGLEEEPLFGEIPLSRTPKTTGKISFKDILNAAIRRFGRNGR